MKKNDLLVIDIGNTNIAVGFFKDGKLIRKFKTPTHSYALYGRKFVRMPDDIIISSVVPLALSRLLVHLNSTGKFNIAILGKNAAVPIKNLYRIKSEVGQDRLVNAYGAKIRYGTPCVIVDFGTAITFDCISKKGEYLGGLILPGIELSLSSLYKNTALLPKVGLKAAPGIIGKDTANSMRGGILFGFGAMCDGLVSQYKKILGENLKVIATGGNASLMKQYASSIQKVDEDLTLQGLHLISQKIQR
ncbi:MAG: type III pantothenate kinase [Candidatus Omnitrophota bacterium]